MRHPHIFDDPSGRRWRFVVRAACATGIVSGCLVLMLVASILWMPALPANPRITDALRAAAHSSEEPRDGPAPPRQQTPGTSADRDLESTLREIAGERSGARDASGGAQPRPIVAAFYAPWEPDGLRSLRSNSTRLTHLLPAWLALTADGSGIDTQDWDPTRAPHNLEALTLARQHRLVVLPVLSNAALGRFDPGRVHALLGDGARQDGVAADLIAWLRRTGCQGINIDFERLDPTDRAKLPAFLRQLRDRFHRQGLVVTADLEPGTPSPEAAAVAAQCDFVVLMAYEEHSSLDPPGPIASLGWTRAVVHRMLGSVPSNKLVLGLGSYAYDWTVGSPRAASLSFEAAMRAAQRAHRGEAPRDIVGFPPSLNATFRYRDDTGARHEVWMLDAVSAANQLQATRQARLAGAALWVLGTEDPTLWTFFDRAHIGASVVFSRLSKVPAPGDVRFDGRGEILSVVSSPRAGFRAIDVDSASNIATGLRYEAFASPYVIQRAGYRDHAIALTFDDGPSAEYTGRILDELRFLEVPATFFVIGENAGRQSSLLKRIVREGHEVGNHTFTHPNLARVSPKRVRWELNATQRVLQCGLGRSTVMFRAPYYSDAEAATADEVVPMLEAAGLGYITIGEGVDPKDWQLTEPCPDGTTADHTAEEIARSVIDQVHRAHGSTVLLHDGGGDRTRTVEALRRFVPELRREGYRFVTVSGLLGLMSADVDPPISAWERRVVGWNRVTLGTFSVLGRIMQALFVAAFVIGILRALWSISFAIARKFGERAHRFDAGYRATVSVVIAAYNEEQVIGWTLHSVLDSDHPPLEVIVVDDGSTDDTAQVVAQEFGSDPRVNLVRQTNAGKAAALNHGLGLVKGEILVCLDADTLFDPHTIPHLVRWFADPRVGAVAGNVKVGNLLNVWTRWQMIEYVSGQNLDRRAYAALHAIAVVPGAVGAWRREAVQCCGGYAADTLAEDMDLTWRIRRAGWRVTTESDARAYTEAPDTPAALFRQRFRWSLGTLQCLWKHRDAFGRYGWFGWALLPTMLLFQVVYQAIAPIVDLRMAVALLGLGLTWLSRGVFQSEWQPLPQAAHALTVTFDFYVFFFAVELVTALIAFRLAREKLTSLWWLFAQRFAYRQLMYAAMMKSVKTALRGGHTGWGKLERKGTVAAADVGVRAKAAREKASEAKPRKGRSRAA